MWCDADKSLYCPEGYQCHIDTKKCIKHKDSAESIILAEKLLPGKSSTKKFTEEVQPEAAKSDKQEITFPQLEAALLPRFCSDPGATATSQQCANGQLCCGAPNQHMCCPHADVGFHVFNSFYER